MRLAAALVSSVALVLAACGGSAGSPQATSSSAPVSSAAVSSGPTAASGPTLDAIRARGELAVGMSWTACPGECVDASGKPEGYSPDIIARIAQEMGVKANMIDTDWDGVIPSLYAKKFDTIISSMTVTDARIGKVLFTQPYMAGFSMFLVKASSAFKTPADLDGKTIAIEAGASQLQQEIPAWKAAGHDFKEILQLGSQAESFVAVDVGRADAALASVITVKMYLKDHPEAVAFNAWNKAGTGIAGPADYDYVAISTRFETPDLCLFMNDVLTEMKQDGTLAAIQTKWVGGSVETPVTPNQGSIQWTPCSQ